MEIDSRVEERTDAIDVSSTILRGSCNSEILKKLFENMMDLYHGQAMESEATFQSFHYVPPPKVRGDILVSVRTPGVGVGVTVW